MQNKLSYYSVLLLVGLVIASGLILAINPFNSAPASAAQARGGATTGNAGPAGNTQVPTGQGEFHHWDDDEPGSGQGSTNGTTTTAIYSYDN